MSTINNDQVLEIFKKVWGKANDLRPKDDIVDELLPFENSSLVGEKYVEDFVLGDSVGITWAGTAQNAFAIDPGEAGNVQQSEITPSQTVLTDILSWGFMSRSAGGGEQAFYDGTKLVMGNHLKSHNKLVTLSKIYGQSSRGLGTVSYETVGQLYRGATYTGSAGSITLTKKDGTTIAFTNGICTVAGSLPTGAKGAILFGIGEFAPGAWVAKKGLRIEQVIAATSVVAASGQLVSWDARLGIIYVDFVPVVATAKHSHYIAPKGWAAGKCMVGAHKILTNNGSLFGIDASVEPLWSGNVFNLNGKKLNLNAILEGISDGINAGGLDEPLDIIVNPRAFAKMSNDEASFRKYNDGLKKTAQAGFDAIEYFAGNGANRIYSSSKIKEGEGYGMIRGTWRCSGSQLPSFRVRGMSMDIITPLADQAGFKIRSFSDQYVMCRMPAQQILWYGGNTEGVDFS